MWIANRFVQHLTKAFIEYLEGFKPSEDCKFASRPDTELDKVLEYQLLSFLGSAHSQNMAKVNELTQNRETSLQHKQKSCYLG